MNIFHLVFILLPVHGTLQENEKKELCETLDCDDSGDQKVCGVRYENGGVIFKIFKNECKLLKFGCRVDDTKTYGIISMKHCDRKSTTHNFEHMKFVNYCPDCSNEIGDRVCAIRPDGEGYKIRIFENECQLSRHNCDNDLKFAITDFFICSHDPSSEDEEDGEDVDNDIFDEGEAPVTLTEDGPKNANKTKNLVVVDGTMFDRRNINESIRNFFAATHVRDLPIRDIHLKFNETTRRKLVNIFGPIKIYKSNLEIPKNFSEDYYHIPTLSSCFHKCPTKCPSTYAPVCGVPGAMAREPSLMFQNHCFMDVAQCKMRWEGKSYTAESSAYIEHSFLFCLGYKISSLIRFLPIMKTLQRMDRLKNKAKFRYKILNMKFFNNNMDVQPNIMG